MALYEVTGPGGEVYEVEGPEGATQAEIVAQVRRQKRKEQLRSVTSSLAPTPAEEGRTFGGYAKEVAKGIPAGIAGLLETGALGASALLPEGAEQSVQSSIKNVGQSVQDYLAPSAGYEDSIVRKGAEALGSTVPFLAAAPLGIAGTVGAVGLGVAAGAGEAQQRAEAAGATPEEISKAMPLGAVVGATEFLPPFRIFKRAVGDELAGGVVNFLKRVLSSAGEEGLQEASANIAQNLISRGLYDPEQGVFTNSGESLGYGAGVGGLLQGLLEMVAGRRMRGPAPEQEESPQLDMFGEGPQVPRPSEEGEVDPATVHTVGGNTLQRDMFEEEDVLAPGQQIPGINLNAPPKQDATDKNREELLERLKQKGDTEALLFAAQKRGDAKTDPLAEQEQAPLRNRLNRLNKRIAYLQKVTTPAPTGPQQPIAGNEADVEGAAIQTQLRQAAEQEQAAEQAQGDVVEEETKKATVAEGLAPQGDLFGGPELTPQEQEVIAGIRENQPKTEEPVAEPSMQGEMLGPKGGILKKKDQMPEKPAAPVVETKPEPAPVAEEEVDEQVTEPAAEVEEPAAVVVPEKAKPAVKPADDTRGTDAVVAEAVAPAKSAPKPEAKAKPAVEKAVESKPQFRGATETAEIAPDSKAAKTVAKVLQKGRTGEVKPIQRKAETYFNKYNRIADAVHVLGADLVLTRGQTQRKAMEVAEWVEKNMPAEVNEALRREIQKFSNMEQRGAVESSRRERMTDIRKASEKQSRNYKKTDEEELATTPETRTKKKEEKPVTPRQLAKTINEVEDAPEPADYDAEQAEYEKQKFGGEYYGPDDIVTNRLQRRPLHPLAIHALENGDLKGALDVLTQHANTRIANTARALMGKLGDTKVKVRPDVGGDPPGVYRTDVDEIRLNEDTGLSPHILLHEVTHALTLKNLRNKGHPATQQLNKLYEATKDYLSGAYGAQNVEEFVAEAFSNPEFQAQLQQIYSDGTEITAWQKFKNIIGNFLRRMVGLSAKPIGSAQDTADALINEILDPNPYGGSETLYGPSPTAFDKMGSWIDNNTSEPTKANLAYAKGWVNQAGGVVREFMMDLLPLNAVADIVEKNIPQAKELFKVLEDMAGSRQKKTQVVHNTHRQFTKVLDTQHKRDQLNNLVIESTRAEVDPSDGSGMNKYKGNAERLSDWKRLRAEWLKAPKEVQQTYESLRDAYKKQYDELLDVIGKRIDSAIEDPAQRKSMRQKILSEIVSKGKIEPYFPLYRRGNYWLSYRAADPQSGNMEFYVEAFENAGDRAKAAQLLRTDPKVQASDIEEYQNFKHIDLTRVPTSFVYQIVKELKQHNLPQDAMDSVMEVFMAAMPETAFVQAFRRRAGTLGFQKDALSVFEERGVSLAQQIVSMQYDAKLQKLSSEINTTASESKDEQVHKDAYRLRDYISFARNPKIETWGKMLKSVGFGMTLGFNVSSVMVNSSNIPVVVLPYLGGRFGYAGTTRAIGDAYRLYMGTGFKRDVETLVPVPDGKGGMTTKYGKTSGWSLHNVDYNDKNLPAEVRELKELSDLLVQRGQVTQSIAADALDFDDKNSSLLTKVNSMMGFMFHHGERLNRQVTAIAAYKLRLNEIKTQKQKQGKQVTAADRQEAAEYAVATTELTNSGALLTTAPRFSQKSTIRNILFMYKRFGVSMFYLQFKMAKEALKSTDKETRRVAKRQIIGLFGSSAVFAGLQGVPLYGIVSMLGNLLFVDDDEEDFDTQMLKFVGEPAFSGAINAMTGTDIAARVGMTNLVFRSRPNEEQDSWLLAAAEMLGGPVFGTVSRMEDGAKLIQDGEIGRGLERMMPAALSSVMRGARYAEEGTTTLRGDPITGEVSPQHYMAQMLGFAPADYTRQLEINAVNKKIDRNVNEKRTNLLRKYYVALRNYDTETMQDTMTEILELNRKHPNAAIDYSTLERSVAQHVATSVTARKYGGVTINRNMQAEVDRLNAEYENE